MHARKPVRSVAQMSEVVRSAAGDEDAGRQDFPEKRAVAIVDGGTGRPVIRRDQGSSRLRSCLGRGDEKSLEPSTWRVPAFPEKLPHALDDCSQP